MLTVPIVTTWDKACGIAEHAHYLVEAIQAADRSIRMRPETNLHPNAFVIDPVPPVLILNYQAGLLSQWSPDAIRDYRRRGGKVISVYHDSGVPSTDQCKAVVDASDVTILHEPTNDLPLEKIRYWRMGVPAACLNPYHFDARDNWLGGDGKPDLFFKSYRNQPVVGSIGFPYPWKCFDQLVETAASVGWGVMLIAPHATDAQVTAWKAMCPDIYVRTDFVPQDIALKLLSACDATAFTYVCHNAGQSGAILQGIATRKPVIAFRTCRQFRSLFHAVHWGGEWRHGGDQPFREVEWNPMDRSHAIRWVATFEEVGMVLQNLQLGRCDARIVGLAERESWKHVGQKYAALIRELAS